MIVLSSLPKPVLHRSAAEQIVGPPNLMSESNQSIPIGISLANCGGRVDAREIYELIANETEGTAGFAFRPHGPAAAALDFFLVLNTVGSVASIAGFLWFVYDKFTGSRKRDSDDAAGIYIAVQRPNGTAIDIFLGRDVLDKKDFIQRFELLVGEANSPDMRLTNEAKVRELELDDSWVKIERK